MASNLRTVVRQKPTDANRFYFDFDAAAIGGKGGAGVKLEPAQGLASIDGVHKNVKLPSRSTGQLLAEGLQQTSMPKPSILEAYNVEATTANVLAAGDDGQGTLLGNLLEDMAAALGGIVIGWDPVKDGNVWHLRLHVAYP